MRFAISSGHGKYVRGASGYLDEVDEARRVVERVADVLRGLDDTEVDTFHDDVSHAQNENLDRIVAWHNGQDRDFDVSVHFNAHQTTSKPMGTECLYVTQDALASIVAEAIAVASGLKDRGAKYRTDLYFLNKTEEPAILIEVCFVDSSADAAIYAAKFHAICTAIAEAITDRVIAPPERPEDLPPIAPPTEAERRYPVNQRNIICTVFGGGDDPNDSAYPPYDPITDVEVSCALPGRFEDDVPLVEVFNPQTGRRTICQIRDIGPWFTDDYYWDSGERPAAEPAGAPIEYGKHEGKTSNGAGIDLTPAAAKAIGIEGKGTVHWRFVDDRGQT